MIVGTQVRADLALLAVRCGVFAAAFEPRRDSTPGDLAGGTVQRCVRDGGGVLPAGEGAALHHLLTRAGVRALFAYLLVGEALTVPALVGCGLILAGMLVAQFAE